MNYICIFVLICGTCFIIPQEGRKIKRFIKIFCIDRTGKSMYSNTEQGFWDIKTK